LRLLNLGQSPLTDGEASLALQALQIGQMGTAAFIPGPYPAYIFLTGATFSIFGAGEFLARLWPALAGTLLVCVPAFFRHELGRKTALVLALAGG
jgi:predicted membrane-bound mannosyltransferase